MEKKFVYEVRRDRDLGLEGAFLDRENAEGYVRELLEGVGEICHVVEKEWPSRDVLDAFRKRAHAEIAEKGK